MPYQTTHNTGGTIMGTNPRDSAVNKYLQSWDCHNLFVVGANVFPHNASYNPTGPVGALAYWTADAIKTLREKSRPAGGGMKRVTCCCLRRLSLPRRARRAPTVTPRAARSGSRSACACHALEQGEGKRRPDPARRVRPQGGGAQTSAIRRP